MPPSRRKATLPWPARPDVCHHFPAQLERAIWGVELSQGAGLPLGTNRGGSALNLCSYAWQRRIESRECSSWDLARYSLSAASCTWHALRFGGDRLVGRLGTLWNRRGAAWDSWGSKQIGPGFSLWQSAQFCWCRGPVPSLEARSYNRFDAMPADQRFLGVPDRGVRFRADWYR